LLPTLRHGATVEVVIVKDIVIDRAQQDSDVGEASGSHQRLVAVLVETDNLRIGPDPMLEKTDRDTLAELETVLYSV
jgi:hypothetical protein